MSLDINMTFDKEKVKDLLTNFGKNLEYKTKDNKVVHFKKV